MVVQPDRATLLLKGALDLCVLAIVASEPTYGYEIHSRLQERGLPVAEGTIYPLLSRLSRAGLVASTTRPSTTGPVRKYYALTPAGRETLRSGSDQWDALSAAVTSILAGTPYHRGG